ncbi:MAG: hypothetical protein H7230_03560 [Candidatus Parcubacteria bacterium]|nr:hypothetical protein [Candidatus Paceibacterota bacterium]
MVINHPTEYLKFNLPDSANLRIIIDKPIVRTFDRSIAVVSVYQGDKFIQTQPFYRSTGHNSHNPGRWFPFSGIDYKQRKGKIVNELVFHKKNFVSDIYPKGDILHRLGDETIYPLYVRDILLRISNCLTESNLVEGQLVDIHTINTYLNTPESMFLEARKIKYEGSLSLVPREFKIRQFKIN